GLDGLVHAAGGHDHFDLYLGQEAHRVFGSAVDFCMTLLPAVTFDFGHGHALQPKVGQGRTYLLELEWLDDGGHQLHCGFPLIYLCRLAHPSADSMPRRARRRRRADRVKSRASPEDGPYCFEIARENRMFGLPT